MRLSTPELITQGARIAEQFDIPRRVGLPSNNPGSKFTVHQLAWRIEEVVQNNESCLALFGYVILPDGLAPGCRVIDPMGLAFSFPAETWLADVSVVKGTASTAASVLSTGVQRTELAFMASMDMTSTSKTYTINNVPVMSIVIPQSVLIRPSDCIAMPTYYRPAPTKTTVVEDGTKPASTTLLAGEA